MSQINIHSYIWTEAEWRNAKGKDSVSISSAASFMTKLPITAANPVMK